MKKGKKITALILAIALLTGLCSPAAAVESNPVDILFAELDVELPKIPRKGFMQPVNGAATLEIQANGLLADVGEPSPTGYAISSVEQFVSYFETGGYYVDEEGDYHDAGDDIYLTEDLDLSEYNGGAWEAVYMYSNSDLTIDGQGHTITVSSFAVCGNDEYGYQSSYAGLFESLTAKGKLTVKNLRLNILSAPTEPVAQMGGITVDAEGSEIRFENCRVDGPFVGDCAAAFVADVTGYESVVDFVDCIADCTYIATYDTVTSVAIGAAKFGGFISPSPYFGQYEGRFLRCISNLCLEVDFSDSTEEEFFGVDVSGLGDAQSVIDCCAQGNIVYLGNEDCNSSVEVSLLAGSLSGDMTNSFAILNEVNTQGSGYLHYSGAARFVYEPASVSNVYTIADFAELDSDCTVYAYGIAEFTDIPEGEDGVNYDRVCVQMSGDIDNGKIIGITGPDSIYYLDSKFSNCRVEIENRGTCQVLGIGNGSAVNCLVELESNGGSYGIGNTVVDVERCAVDFNVRNLEPVDPFDRYGAYFGGIAGTLKGSARKCVARGTLYSSPNNGVNHYEVGGLFRRALCASEMVECHFDGDLCIDGVHVCLMGGLVGKYDCICSTPCKFDMMECSVSGTFQAIGGGTYVGGLIGCVRYGNPLRLYDCHFRGSISAESSRKWEYSGETYSSTAGGLIAECGEADLAECSAAGAVKAYTAFASSVAGGAIGAGGNIAIMDSRFGMAVASQAAATLNENRPKTYHAYAGGVVGYGNDIVCYYTSMLYPVQCEVSHPYPDPTSGKHEGLVAGKYSSLKAMNGEETEDSLPPLELSVGDEAICYYSFDEDGNDTGERLAISALMGQDYMGAQLFWIVTGSAAEIDGDHEILYEDGTVCQCWITLKGLEPGGSVTVTCFDLEGNSASAVITVEKHTTFEEDGEFADSDYTFREPLFYQRACENGQDPIVINGAGNGYYYLEVAHKSGKAENYYGKPLYYRLQRVKEPVGAGEKPEILSDSGLNSKTPLDETPGTIEKSVLYSFETEGMKELAQKEETRHYRLLVYGFEAESDRPVSEHYFSVKVQPMTSWHEWTFGGAIDGKFDLAKYWASKNGAKENPDENKSGFSADVGAAKEASIDIIHEYVVNEETGRLSQDLTFTFSGKLTRTADGGYKLGKIEFKKAKDMESFLRKIFPDLDEWLFKIEGDLSTARSLKISRKITGIESLEEQKEEVLAIMKDLFSFYEALEGDPSPVLQDITSLTFSDTWEFGGKFPFGTSGSQAYSSEVRFTLDDEALGSSSRRFVEGYQLKYSQSTPKITGFNGESVWTSAVKYYMTHGSEQDSMFMRYQQNYDTTVSMEVGSISGTSVTVSPRYDTVFYYDDVIRSNMLEQSSRFRDLWNDSESVVGNVFMGLPLQLAHSYGFHKDLWRDAAYGGAIGMIAEKVLVGEMTTEAALNTSKDGLVSAKLSGNCAAEMEYADSRGILDINEQLRVTSISNERTLEILKDRQTLDNEILFDFLGEAALEYICTLSDVVDVVDIASENKYILKNPLVYAGDIIDLLVMRNSSPVASRTISNEEMLMEGDRIFVEAKNEMGEPLSDFEGVSLRLPVTMLGDVEIAAGTQPVIVFYDQETDAVIPCETTYDAETGIASAPITRNGEYDLVYDLNAPVISEPLIAASDTLKVELEFFDETQVDKDSVEFAVDGKLVEMEADWERQLLNATMTAPTAGEHVLTVTVADVLGNRMDVLECVFTAYDQSPVISDVKSPTSASYKDAIEVSAQVESAESVALLYGENGDEYFTGCVEMQPDQNGRYIGVITDGKYYSDLVYQIVAENVAGETTSEQKQIDIQVDMSVVEEQLTQLRMLHQSYSPGILAQEGDRTKEIKRAIKCAEDLLQANPSMLMAEEVSADLESVIQKYMPENGLILSDVSLKYGVDTMNVHFQVTNLGQETENLMAVVASFDGPQMQLAKTYPVTLTAGEAEGVFLIFPFEAFDYGEQSLKVFLLSANNMKPQTTAVVEMIR